MMQDVVMAQYIVLYQILPPPSNIHHQNNDGCLLGKTGKLSGLFCAVLCATVMHSAMHTHEQT